MFFEIAGHVALSCSFMVCITFCTEKTHSEKRINIHCIILNFLLNFPRVGVKLYLKVTNCYQLIKGRVSLPDIEISVVIPVKNIEKYIPAIIENLTQELTDISMELVVVDMYSSDKTMLSALKAIKASGQSGFVIQNGVDGLPGALNAGIFKATGKYVTFLFPRKIYKNMLAPYFFTAQKHHADFVFGSAPGCDTRLSAALKSKAIKGTEVITGVVKGIINIDLAAVLISRELLQKKNIFFNAASRYGFAEEFIYRLLLKTDANYQASAVLHRDTERLLPPVKQEPLGIACFDRVEGLIKISDLLHYSHGDGQRLYELFIYTVLPGAVFDCIDLLLREGMGYSAVKNAIRLKGYETLLVSGKTTDSQLKRKIFTWKLMPWMYKPTK